MSNKYLARWARRVLYDFPKAFDNADGGLVGNPVRAEIADLPEPASLCRPRRPSESVGDGGSLGADVLNKTLPEALYFIAEEARPQIYPPIRAQRASGDICRRLLINWACRPNVWRIYRRYGVGLPRCRCGGVPLRRAHHRQAHPPPAWARCSCLIRMRSTSPTRRRRVLWRMPRPACCCRNRS